MEPGRALYSVYAVSMTSVGRRILLSTYRIAGYFRGTKFSRIAQTHFADFIFEDRGSFEHNPTVNNDFKALNFRGSKVNLENRKNFVPRK